MMGPDFKDTFDDHVIVSEVRAPGFASWMLKRSHEGRTSGVFWCRVTAADGLLRVSGDFDPVVFQGHLSHKDDPESRVAWMGARDKVDSYVMEKARSGTGREAVETITVEHAIEDLKELISDNNKQIAGHADDAFKDSDGDYEDEIEGIKEENAALQAGIEAACEEYNSMPYACAGVLNMMEAIRDYSYQVRDPANDCGFVKAYRTVHVDVEAETYCRIGERPAQRVVLAHRAVQCLHRLLEARGERWQPGDVLVGTGEGPLDERMIKVLHVLDETMVLAELVAVHTVAGHEPAWRERWPEEPLISLWKVGAQGEIRKCAPWFTDKGQRCSERKWRRATEQDIEGAANKLQFRPFHPVPL